MVPYKYYQVYDGIRMGRNLVETLKTLPLKEYPCPGSDKTTVETATIYLRLHGYAFSYFKKDRTHGYSIYIVV